MELNDTSAFCGMPPPNIVTVAVHVVEPLVENGFGEQFTVVLVSIRASSVVSSELSS